MNKDMITCPKCNTEIPITEVLQGQIEGRIRKEYDRKWNTRENGLKEREDLISKREKASVIERESFELLVSNQVNEKLEREREILTTRIRAEEKKENDLKFAQLKLDNEALDKRLGKFKSETLDAQKRELKAKQDKDDLETGLQKQINKAREEAEQKVGRKVHEEYRLKLADSNKKLSDANNQLKEAQKKLQQGSQQFQGEVLELELEHILKSYFPHDNIIPIAKGAKGADVIQKVITSRGELCGTILWESKRTKTWSDSWISKLKDDQLEQKADHSILYSVALPKDVQNFTRVKDVWITGHNTLLAIATLARAGLIDIARYKKTAVGKSHKEELVYAYFTSKEFAQRVELILQTYKDMNAQIDHEKIAMHKIWSKREKQLERVQINLASMFGGFEEIAGATLPQLKSLELTALPDSSSIQNDSTSVDDEELPF